MYVPLFGQRLAHLMPVAAGFLGVALAVGWTVSEIVSASLTARGRSCGWSGGAAGDGGRAWRWVPWPGTATTRRGVALWAVALLVAGIGIGMAWPHLSALGDGSPSTDPAEGGAAAAAINTVQLISAAFGAGLAGVVVNTATGGEQMAAHMLFTVFTALSAAGVAVSYAATRATRQAEPVGTGG